MSVLRERLDRQRLTGADLSAPEAVVSHLVAVQSQDYYGAAWGLGQRARALHAVDVDAAFDAGRILRTHVLRPTWHFVTPADIGWLLALTGPRVQRSNIVFGRRIGLDEKTFTRARTVIERALAGGGALTRRELADRLARSGVMQAAEAARSRAPRIAAGQPIAHVLMHAELAGTICSGPRHGRQFTYALMAERAPQAERAFREFRKDEALAMLAARYFASRAPATVEDFAWWSGLTRTDARRGVAAAGITALATPAPPGQARGQHRLLPNFDEYVIAYRDRGALLDAARARNLGMLTSAHYPHFVILDGRIAGS